MIEGAKVFTVPLYQRRYSWKKDNWRELWQDILEQYDYLVEGQGGPVTHFIGSFVLAPGADSGEYTKLVVVDGQQRLTTIMILLAAIRDELASKASTSDQRTRTEAKYNELYLQNMHAEVPGEQLRLLPTQQDRQEFLACVGQTPAQPFGKMGEAYDFFRSDEALQGRDLRGDDLDLRRVSDVVGQRLTVVEITTQRGDSVHQIFQTLNHAGVKLKQVDLLRNHFFMLLPTRGEELYSSIWRQMELRLGDAALDRFFWANLVRRDARVTRNDVYVSMQRRLDPIARDEDAVASVLTSFAEDLESFAALVESATGVEAIDERLSFLNAWGADTAQPLVLELLVRWRDGRLGQAQVGDALQLVESFIVRRMICGIPTNNLNRLFTSMATVMAAPDFGPSALASFLAGEKRYWPTDDDLRFSILNSNFEAAGRPWQRTMVLERLLDVAPDQSVDHVIARIAPAVMDTIWLDAFGDEGEGPSAFYRRVAGTLGNLTLVASEASPLRATDWFTRAEELHRAGADLASLNGSPRLTGDDLLLRGRALARAAALIWPGPVGESSAVERSGYVGVESLVRALPASSTVLLDDIAEVLSRKRTSVASAVQKLEPRLQARVLPEQTMRRSDTISYLELLDLVDDGEY